MDGGEVRTGSGKDDYLVNSDGQRLFCKYWYPKEGVADKLKAVVFLCHGAGEHCQYYGKIADALTDAGMMAFAHDHVGHGLSEGDRVHIDSFDTYVNDVILHLEMIKKKHPNVPSYIVGHSMGGTIAIKAALDHPTAFAGVVLIAPAIITDKETVTPFKVFLARFVARLLPQMQVSPIIPELLSKDPYIVKQYKEDSLVYHGGLKAKWSVIILNTLDEIQKRFSEIRWPFLILHGTEDKICGLEGSQMMCDQAMSTDKTLKAFEGALHQVHNESNGVGQQVVEDLVSWISRLLPSQQLLSGNPKL